MAKQQQINDIWESRGTGERWKKGAHTEHISMHTLCALARAERRWCMGSEEWCWNGKWWAWERSSGKICVWNVVTRCRFYRFHLLSPPLPLPLQPPLLPSMLVHSVRLCINSNSNNNKVSCIHNIHIQLGPPQQPTFASPSHFTNNFSLQSPCHSQIDRERKRENIGSCEPLMRWISLV